MNAFCMHDGADELIGGFQSNRATAWYWGRFLALTSDTFQRNAGVDVPCGLRTMAQSVADYEVRLGFR